MVAIFEVLRFTDSGIPVLRSTDSGVGIGYAYFFQHFGCGIVHFDTHQDASIFLKVMKGRTFCISKTVMIKFSEAYKFGTKEPIQFEKITSEVQILIPSQCNPVSRNNLIMSQSSREKICSRC
ncbi:hypothetical protein Glove_65g22 [Diversispora epigaea]|uniref:Uncharacterized protein n=1 Tax=Diversispora epigaea TaxID=1348612 RepID=A0A397JKJ5_9GLOM|nr:hypothetical protein Glove_65g22 [Diversispora epigaea]